MRIFAVVLLAVMPFAGFTESSSLSGSSSRKSYRKSSGSKHKSKKKSRKLDSSKLAEGKKAIEEDKKLGIVFENSKDGIVLKRFLLGNKSYQIPYGVTEIEKGAFLGCRKLTSITIPDSVNKIGDFAFASCVRLTSITLPSRFKGQERRLRIPARCRIIYR